MNVYEAKTYRDFLNARLASGSGKRGAAKKLALYLKCHSTYISQVSNGKADFSVDQGLRFCSYCQLTPDQTEFFLDLLCRDRAATKEAKAHYQERVGRRLAEISDVKYRWRRGEALTAEQEMRYFGSWITQAVHLYCQLPGSHKVESIAEALGVDLERVTSVVAELETMGLVEHTARGLQSLRPTAYVGKDSPLISTYHASWRLKTLTDITARGSMPGKHYSFVVSLSEKTAREVEKLIMAHMDATSTAILPSPPESLYVYCLDFYPLLANNQANQYKP